MAEVETKEVKEGTEQEAKETKTETKENKVDVEKVKKGAIASLLEELGLDDTDSLKAIVTKSKEDEAKNQTELQKSDTALKQAVKQLTREREEKLIAEAKLSAIQLGAKKELVDDLVIVAKSKVTKDKDINEVISEMKESETGKIYFAEEEKEKEENQGTVTRKSVTKNKTKQKDEQQEEHGEEKHEGTMAARILAKRKQTKSHYYK